MELLNGESHLPMNILAEAFPLSWSHYVLLISRGIWESVHNPDFNYGEFDIIKSQAGLNSYRISIKEWVKKTNAIGLMAKAGRYGGTYAHRDLALEFGMWISPKFKIYLNDRKTMAG